MRFSIGLLVVAGCHSAGPARPAEGTPPPAPSGSVALPDAAAPDASDAIAPVLAAASCAATGSVTLAPRDPRSIENVRVAFASRALVTWEDENAGAADPTRSANAAWIDWSPTPHTTTAILPYRAYASAVYSYIGPTRGNGLELFTYGLAGLPTFERFAQKEAVWAKIDPNMGSAPTPTKALVVDMSVEEAFAVADSAPVAAVAGEETPCESLYSCESIYLPALRKGFEASVRVVALGAKPSSEVVWRSGSPRSNRGKTLPFAPAIAFGATKGAVVFRVERALMLSNLDAAFHPSPPVTIATGDVGAPAVAMKGDSAVVAWAERASPTEPYHLVIWDGAPHVVKSGAASAVAPSLAVRDAEVVVAWMEGDAERHGQIRLGRAPLSGEIDLTSAPVLSEAGVNARDPEISLAGDEVVLVWSEFSKTTKIQARKLTCPR